MSTLLLQNFHFLYPLWLLALLPLALLLWFIIHPRTTDSAWSKVIDANLLPLLLNKGQSSNSGKAILWLLSIAWFISIMALADPAWEKKPKPVFQTESSRIIVLDLSRSMSIQDMKPSRLARARFKVEDILRKEEEGQVGLVAFAGDAFSVSPLTRDVKTIRALLPALTPSLMPIQGSRADLGLLKAGELLQQAGIAQGEILLITDGAEGKLAQRAAKELSAQGYTVSVLAVGTETGGPIPNATDRQGKKVVVPVKIKELEAIAQAGGGRYSPVLDRSTDIDYLMTSNQLIKGSESSKESDDMKSDDWKEQGPLLVLLLLPFAALAFRRGWLVSVMLAVTFLAQPKPAIAFPAMTLGWQDLWQRSDQQADKALRAGDFEAASELAETPLRRGSADYKRGEYESALQAFSEAQNAEGAYNKGNALAKLGKYEEAIKAYDEALQQQENLDDARTNKKRVEDLLKKQKEQEQKQDKNKKGDKESDKKDSNDKQDSEKKGKEEQSSDEKQGEEKSDSGRKEQENDKNHSSNEDKDKKNEFSEAAKNLKKDQEQSKEDKEKEEEPAKQQQPLSKPKDEDKKADDKKAKAAEAKANELNKEEKIAADQWLRRIPDDPGGLLRRKFKYQYQQRPQREGTGGSTPW